MKKINQLKWHKTFLKIAKIISLHSTCKRIQVGAILTKDSRIISTGYNGTPSGKKHCNEIFKNADLTSENFKKEHGEWSKINELHGESNCILSASKNGISTKDTVLYITLSPCIDCAKQILSAGIKEVYYIDKYDRDITGIKYLQDSGIKISQIKDIDNE